MTLWRLAQKCAACGIKTKDAVAAPAASGFGLKAKFCKTCSGRFQAEAAQRKVEDEARRKYLEERQEAVREIQNATKAGSLEKVKSLLKGNPDLVRDATSNGNRTPLHTAALNGHRDVAELLLTHGADVNAATGVGRPTPLHMAAEMGHKDVAELLLANKAEVNAADGSGPTPLHVAARNGQKGVAELLLAHGADVNAKTEEGYYSELKRVTPLLMAVRKGHRDVAELLLAHGADVNAESNLGTPLSFATLHGQTEMAELLRQHGGHK